MSYDNIKVGDEVPSLTTKITRVQMVMYCAITWDFSRYHYDAEFVQNLGFPKPVVDPQMHGGFLARMLTDWISGSGKIRKLSLRYRAPCFLGDSVTYGGKVANKYAKNGEKYVDCDLVVANEKGEHLVEGAAVISVS